MKNSKTYKIIFAVVAIGLAIYLFNIPTKIAVGAKARDAEAVAIYQHSTSLIGHLHNMNLLWMLILLPIGLLLFMSKEALMNFIQRQKPNTALWLAMCCIFMLSATTVIKTGQTNIGWHNVLDKGAVGDGTTDNTTAFRANEHDIAVAGSGVFFVPAGHFLVSASIPIPVTTTFFGMGGIAEQSDSTTSGK